MLIDIADLLIDAKKAGIWIALPNKTLIVEATHSGSAPIGNLTLPCFVLADGTRVLSERGLLGDFDIKAGVHDTEEKLPRYLRELMNITNNFSDCAVGNITRWALK